MDERYDAEALRLARQAVIAGESVLWAGRPGRRRAPGWGVAHAVVPLAVIAWSFGSLVVNEPYRINEWWQWLVPWVMAAPFAVILGVHLWWMWRQGREIYAVTDWRVLILTSSGAVRSAVALAQAEQFRRVGRTVHLGGEDEAWRRGKTDLDGGLARFDALPKLERLGDAERVMAIIKAAAPKAPAAT